MAQAPSYCDVISTLASDDVNRVYHDTVYGFPVTDDRILFERLILEINQAGLSWTTILKKQSNFRKAYHDFDIARIARYGDKDRERLLADAGIIRNRLKIDAAIHNANAVLTLRKEYGSFHSWLEAHHPLDKESWVKLFKKTFRFTGGEIVNEFLMSTGYLPGAHIATCTVYGDIMKAEPAWMRGKTQR
jgi:DNA-3-methyladenine glycosylase I